MKPSPFSEAQCAAVKNALTICYLLFATIFLNNNNKKITKIMKKRKKKLLLFYKSSRIPWRFFGSDPDNIKNKECKNERKKDSYVLKRIICTMRYPITCVQNENSYMVCECVCVCVCTCMLRALKLRFDFSLGNWSKRLVLAADVGRNHSSG